VLLGNGNGTFAAPQTFAVGSSPVAVAVADLTGDGKPDILTADSGSNDVSVLGGNGDGTFAAAQRLAVGSRPYAVAVADLTGDGRQDIVTADAGGNDVSVLLSNGDGTFQQARTFAVGLHPTSLVVADVNSDGVPDLLTANKYGNNVSVLLGNGAGSFQPALGFAAGSSPVSVAVADVNGDGRPDILTANTGSNDLSVLLGSAGLTFQAPQTFAVGYGTSAVAAGDLNGDGRPDLVTANKDSNSISVQLSNPDGTFQPVQTFAVGFSPTSVTLADLTGDGIPDIVVADAGSNDLSVIRTDRGRVSGYRGLDFNASGGYVPPDSQGAAGPSVYVETVNQTVALYAKATGVPIGSDSLFDFFLTQGNLQPPSNFSYFSDPVVVYDDQPGVQRFIVGDQNIGSSSGQSNFDLAVSKTSDPTTLTAADWNFYQINTTESGFIADYPGNLGFNADALVFTLNMYALTPGSTGHVQVNSVSMQDLVNGVGQKQLHYYQNDFSGFSLRPTTMHDARPGDPMWLLQEDPTHTGSAVDVVQMTDVLSNSASFTTTALTVHPYTEVVPPLQPDGSAVTYDIDSRIQKAAESGGTLVATQAVALSGTQDAAQWYQIDVASGTPVLVQQGDVSLGDNTYATYPGIDINPAGDIGLSFMSSGTAPGQYLSMYVTGRTPQDPAGTMEPPVLVQAGSGLENYHDYTFYGRAGDLSGINVDPSNGSFWAVNEFANTESGTFSGNWGTAIANFTPGPLTIANGTLLTTFQSAGSIAAGSSPSSVAVANLGGDGQPALVVADQGSNSVSVLSGLGFSTRTEYNGYPGLDFNASQATGEGFVPPDSQGAAGPSVYLEAVNQVAALYDKATGQPIIRDSLGDFFQTQGGLPPTDSGAFLADPAVVYDDQPGVQRFIITDQSIDETTYASSIDLAVSKTSDPTTLTAADWNFYQINTSETGFIADYPGNLGYNADALVFTLNKYDVTTLNPDHVQVTSVNVQDLVNDVPQEQVRTYQNDIGFSPTSQEQLLSYQFDVNDFSLRPATEHDAKPGDPLWLVQQTGDGQHITVYKMTDVLSNNATFTATQLAVQPYTQIHNNVPPLQPDGTAVTDNADSGIQKAAEANGTLVAAQAVALSPTQDAARWYQIDVSSGTPVLVQQGDVSLGDNTYATYPAIDINPAGDIGLSFMSSGTAPGQYLSMYVTGRTPQDPAGAMGAPVLVPDGTGLENYHDFSGTGQAGDMSGINVDPSNGSFWAVNEFANTESGTFSANWGTAIANFTLAPASPAAITNGSLQIPILTAQTVRTYAVGALPSAVAVADLTGNGKQDIVVADAGSNDVSVLLGNGDGTFGPARTFAAGTSPSAVAVADLNHDGIPDLVVADAAGNDVAVLRGNGDGSFWLPRTYAVGSDPTAVAVADVNGDGIPDLITANYGSNDVSILAGNGDGFFQPAVNFAAGTSPAALAVVVTSGGRPDLLVADAGSDSVSLLEPGVTFQAPVAVAMGSRPAAVVVADLTGNGRPDIITANTGSNDVSVLVGNADGTFQTPRDYAAGPSPVAVVVADLTGDGIPDLIVADSGGNCVSVLLGNGDGTFGPAQTFAAGSFPSAVAVADVNGDGKPDLVVADSGSDSVSVLLGNGDGTFAAPRTFAAGAQPSSVAVADLTGDGKQDIVVADSGGNCVSVLLGNGDGSFHTLQTFAVGVSPSAVAVANLSGDGHPDIVTANAGSNDVSVLLGNGDGTFKDAEDFAAGSAPAALAVADVNGDGTPDVLTANAGSNDISVLVGNGDGTLQAPRLALVGQHPISVVVAKLTGDGTYDVITANAVGNDVSVLLGNGDGTFQTAQTYAAGLHPTSVAVADLTGDGTKDIVVADAGGYSVSVLLGNGDGSFGKSQTYTAGIQPSAVAVADVNGDGIPDLVVANAGDNTVSVLLGNGDGTFQASQTYPVGSAPAGLAVADLGNGHQDIVVADKGSNAVSVLLGQGGRQLAGYVGLDVNSGGLYVPPDSQGAAGPSVYIETVNQATAIYDKSTGRQLALDSLDDFFTTQGGLPRTDKASFFTDPAIVYDDQPGVQRFIISNQDVDLSGPSSTDIAVSKTSDPKTLTAADWNFYQIDTTESTSTLSFFTDYPGNMGYNANALVFTLNLYNAATFAPDHVEVISVSTADLAKGVANPAVYRNDFAGFNLRPTTMHDAKPGDPMWLIQEDPTHLDKAIDVVKMTDVLSNDAAFTTTPLTVNPYMEVVPPLQPGGSFLTFNIDSGIQKAAESGGTLVASQAVASSYTQDAARWYQIDVSSGTPKLVQQGDVSLGDNTYATYPAIDINAAGDIGMTFLSTGTDSPTDFLSMYVTGRTPQDPQGQMETPVLVPAGTGQAINTDFRAGDMSGINVDPTNGSFWAVNEYANAEYFGSWGTAIADFTPGPVTISNSTLQPVFEPAQNYALGPGSAPVAVAVAKLSGDGKQDVVVADSGSNAVSVLLGNGDGTFQDPQTFAVGRRPSSVAVADLTGNGKQDIVVSDAGGNAVSVLLGNGDGTFQATQNFVVGSAPSSVTVADLTGNGLLDILTANEESNNVSVLLGTGTGGFVAVGVQPTTTVTTTGALSSHSAGGSSSFGLPGYASVTTVTTPVTQVATLVTTVSPTLPLTVSGENTVASVPTTSFVLLTGTIIILPFSAASSAGGGAGGSGSSGGEALDLRAFELLPSDVTGQARLELPTEKEILEGMDPAASFVRGVGAQAKLVQQRGTVAPIGALLPIEAEMQGNRQGTAGGKVGGVETFLISPIDGALLGPAVSPKSPPPEIHSGWVNPKAVALADALFRRRTVVNADRPGGSGPDPHSRPTARRHETYRALVLAAAIGLISSSLAGGMHRGPDDLLRRQEREGDRASGRGAARGAR
jgi:hypothetical protein